MKRLIVVGMLVGLLVGCIRHVPVPAERPNPAIGREVPR